MTVSEQIIQVVDALCKKFGIAIDWTSKNVIPYLTILCKKLVTYEIVTSILGIIVALLVMIASVIATKKLYPVFKKGLEEDDKYGNCGWWLGTVFAIVGLVIVNIISICELRQQINDVIKCIIFPEMYIFEYIQGIINAG